MEEPTYKIEPDDKARFLRLPLTGDWNMDIAARFATDVEATLRRMLQQGVRHGELLTLIDMRRKHILPQNVATEFVSGALHRLQSKRLSDDRRASFDDEAEALRWLHDGPGMGTTSQDSQMSVFPD